MNSPLSSPGQVIDAWPTKSDTDYKAVLLRTKHMEVMRMRLGAGARIPTHEAQGEITILCVQGRVEVAAWGCRHELNSGQLLYLLIREPFELAASEESSLLITIIREDLDELIGEGPSAS